jgi:hypothetical protein
MSKSPSPKRDVEESLVLTYNKQTSSKTPSRPEQIIMQNRNDDRPNVLTVILIVLLDVLTLIMIINEQSKRLNSYHNRSKTGVTIVLTLIMIVLITANVLNVE